MLLISCTTPGKVLLRSLPGWVPLGTCTIELLGSVSRIARPPGPLAAFPPHGTGCLMRAGTCLRTQLCRKGLKLDVENPRIATM